MGNEIGGKQSKTAGAKCNDINNMVESTSSNVNYINDPVSTQYNFAAVSEMGPPVRNKSTQTVTRPSVSNKKPVKSVGTQTFMTMDKISEILFNGMNIAECQSASIGTQTFESEVSETSTLPVLIDSALSPSDNQLPLIDEKSSPSENFSDPIDDYSSDHDEHKKDLDQYGESFDEESESVVDSDDEEEEKPKKVILSCNKSPQDQQKFIVFEESLVKCFKHCFKCNSECIVSLESTIGTFSQISVNCLKDSNHSFHWSTGPLHNRLPVFHLLITAGILASGLECGKVLRLFDSLQIKCITRREFSTLQSVYAIPAVFNVWDRERNLLLRQIKGTSRCIASDMRVDSPGHTGLFGSGSSMDVEKNVILDTQIIKSTEVKNSNAMELESLKRQLTYLENANIRVTKLVTDRHTQVSTYMANEKKDIEHAYDVWHVAKEYVHEIQSECVKLRQKYPTCKKASENAKTVLPEEPSSLVKTYLQGNPREKKEDVVSRKRTRFTKPALPQLEDTTIVCQCKGKCATRRCFCKLNDRRCSASCTCKPEKCTSR